MADKTPRFGWPTHTGAVGRALLVMGVVLATLTSLLAPGALAQAPAADQDDIIPAGDNAPAVVIPIHGEIEPGIGHFLSRAIDEAEANDAAAIVLDINTPGGRLDTVLDMRNDILDTDIPVIAYVDRQAFSAGALITIASDRIWMTSGAVLGAATPINGGTGETASEKMISAVRSTFRSTAEKQGRDPQIAEAMVDPEVAVEGLDNDTSLLTLTTQQARQYGYADGVAETREELLAQLGLGDAPVTVAEETLAEHAVRWITNPVVASLLILLGLALIVIDALVGGFGVVALIGLGCLGLFFWGHLLANFAGWEDLVLIVVGLVLIAIEVFVIPGFGVAGVLGLLSLTGGLVLTMTSRSFGDPGFVDQAVDVLQTLLLTLALTVLAIVLFAWALPRLVPTGPKPAHGPRSHVLTATVTEGGGKVHKPGWLTRLLGGGEVLERDTEGHTSTRPQPGADPNSPRDPGQPRHMSE